jgi:hypothetical protein
VQRPARQLEWKPVQQLERELAQEKQQQYQVLLEEEVEV